MQVGGTGHQLPGKPPEFSAGPCTPSRQVLGLRRPGGSGARGHLQTEGCGHGEPQAKQAVPRWAGQGPVQVTPTDGFRDNTGNALVTSAEKPSWQAVMGAGGWVVA